MLSVLGLTESPRAGMRVSPQSSGPEPFPARPPLAGSQGAAKLQVPRKLLLLPEEQEPPRGLGMGHDGSLTHHAGAAG